MAGKAVVTATPIPNSLQIGPFMFLVRSDPALFMVSEVNEGAQLYGRTHLLDATIDLRPGIAPSIMRETLMHEFVHTLFFTARLKDDNEEEIVSRLSPLLLMALRTNPALVRYLLDGC